MSKKAVHKDDFSPDFFDPETQDAPVIREILRYLRELSPTWKPYSPPERHTSDMALGVLLLARGIQIVDDSPPQVRLTHSGERWHTMLKTNACGDRTSGLVLNFVWVAWKNAQEHATANAEKSGTREDVAKKQKSLPESVASTKRIYSGPKCLNCGAQKVEYFKASEFAKKAAIPLRTVQDRMAKQVYCQDRLGRLPWCATCKAKTPEGDGAHQPPSADHAPARALRAKRYKPTLEEVEQYRAWGGDRNICECAMEQSAKIGRPLTRDEFDELAKHPLSETCDLTEEDENAIQAMVRKICKPDKQEDAAQDLRLAWLYALPKWNPEKASRATFRTRVLTDAVRMEWRKEKRQKRANHATISDSSFERDDGSQTSLLENLPADAHHFRHKKSPKD